MKLHCKKESLRLTKLRLWRTNHHMYSDSRIYLLWMKGLVFYLYLQMFHLDFSISSVIFAAANFDKRKFLRHPVDLQFQGKWPLAPSSFERLSYSQRFILQNYQMKSAGIMSLMLGSLYDWLPELCRLQPQLYFIQLQHQFQLLLLCSDRQKYNRKLF